MIPEVLGVCLGLPVISFNFIFAASNELVFINFYADWCRFSNMLAPIFDEAADKVTAEFTTPGRVVMGKVDCDKEGTYFAKLI